LNAVLWWGLPFQFTGLSNLSIERILKLQLIYMAINGFGGIYRQASLPKLALLNASQSLKDHTADGASKKELIS